MRSILLFFVLVGAAWPGANSSDAAYAPLWLYNGSWQISRKDAAKPDQLVNTCGLVGRYFTCQQTVNGTPSELLVFVPARAAGHYYTQSVNPDGRAGGRGDLEITADKWVYSSTWDAGGHTVYYRTTNVFTSKDRIHFEQAESENNRDWTVKMSGDEVRVGNPPPKIVL